MSDLPEVNERVIALRVIAATLRTPVAAPFELPEPSFVLNLASRKSDPVREFKYLHQMSTLHVENFRRANQLKVVALVDGYLVVADAENPLGLYLFARTILELNALLFDVTRRLVEVASKPDENWKPKGEEFFALIVRARFATTHPKKKSVLEGAGAGSKTLKPFNIMNSIKKLATDPDFGDLAGAYDDLCDFVHHNLSSQVAASTGFRVAEAALSSGGGRLQLLQPAPVTRYEYPLSLKARLAIDDTIDVVRRSAEACVKWLNGMPHTPFSPERITQITGTALGFTQLAPARTDKMRAATAPKVGRNELCPCGSKRKFKYCCEAPGH